MDQIPFEIQHVIQHGNSKLSRKSSPNYIENKIGKSKTQTQSQILQPVTLAISQIKINKGSLGKTIASTYFC